MCTHFLRRPCLPRSDKSIFLLVCRHNIARFTTHLLSKTMQYITENHKSYANTQRNKSCCNCRGIYHYEQMLSSLDSKLANQSWLDVIDTAPYFQHFFSEISVKSNLLIHQSQANCSLVGCWKVFVVIWQIMQAVVELAKSRFIQRKCLCVFSRLWKLTSMSRNFLQNVYSQSIQNALKTQCSDINCSWMRWIRNRNQKPFVAFTFLGDCPLSDIALSDIAFQIWIWGGGD